jgi:hypothetical protein
LADRTVSVDSACGHVKQLNLSSTAVLMTSAFTSTIHSKGAWKSFHTSSYYAKLTVVVSMLFSNAVLSSFGGLGPLVPKFAGSNPAEAVGFLRAEKSSARLPSEGK